MKAKLILLPLGLLALFLAGCQEQIGSADTGPAVNEKSKAANAAEGGKKGAADFDEAK